MVGLFAIALPDDRCILTDRDQKSSSGPHALKKSVCLPEVEVATKPNNRRLPHVMVQVPNGSKPTPRVPDSPNNALCSDTLTPKPPRGNVHRTISKGTIVQIGYQFSNSVYEVVCLFHETTKGLTKERALLFNGA